MLAKTICCTLVLVWFRPLEDETSSESPDEPTDSQSVTSSEEEDDSEEWKEEGEEDLELKESEADAKEPEPATSAAKTRTEIGASIKSKMKTIFPGDGENFPTFKDIIRVHYTARIIGRTELLESTRERGSAFEFMLGRGEVIEGWEECLPLMSVGQHCIINCPPEVCYGEKGIMPVIPPSSSFEFDIQLISFRPQPVKTSYELRVFQEGDDPEDEPPTPRSDEEKSASESTDSDPVDSDDSDFKRMNFGDASPTSVDTPTHAGGEGEDDGEGKEADAEPEDSDSFEGVGDEEMDVSKYDFDG